MPISTIDLPSFVVTFIFVLFLALFILLALLLLVPVNLEAIWRWDERPRSRMKVAWLFGLISKDLTSKDKKSDEKREKKTKERSDEGKRKDEDVDRPRGEKEERWISGREALSVLRTEGLIRNLELLALRMIRAVKVRFLKVRLKVGLEDPADTGVVFGLLQSLAAPFDVLDSADMKIEPSFEEEAFEGEASCSFRIWPIMAVLPVFRFVFSAPTLKAAWKLIMAKRRS